MTKKPKFSREQRQTLADLAVSKFGPSQPAWGSLPGGDHRVAFAILVCPEERTIEMVCAVPPSSISWLEDGTGMRALDVHFGTPDGGPCEGGTKERVASHIERMLNGWNLPGEMIGEFLHARRFAYIASIRGHKWTDAGVAVVEGGR